MSLKKRKVGKKLILAGLPVAGRVIERTPVGAIMKELGVLDAIGDVLKVPRKDRNEDDVYDVILNTNYRELSKQIKDIEDALDINLDDFIEDEEDLAQAVGDIHSAVIKPGYKTSELYHSIAVSVVGLLVSYNLMSQETGSVWASLIAAILPLLVASVGYISSRTVVKKSLN